MSKWRYKAKRPARGWLRVRIGGLAGLLLLSSMLGLTACSRTSPYGKGFRFPLSAEPVQLDPQVAQDAASVTVLRSLMEGLTRLDEEGTAVPAAASSWTVSPDGRTYVFTLAPAVWQDGTAVTADDFVYAWERLADPAMHSPYRRLASGIADMAATDAQTLRVTLVAADRTFPETVAESAFFPCPRRFFEASGGRYGLETEYVAVNGAFTLSVWSHGEYLILDKNEAYREADAVAPSRVRYRISPVDDPVAALEDGTLDAVALTASQAQEAQRQKLPVVTLSDSVYALWMRTDLPLLQELSVRQALRSAIVYDYVDQALTELGGIRADGFLPPDVRLFHDRYERGTSMAPASDAAHAAALWAKAAPDRSALSSLTLLCENAEPHLHLAQYIVQSWQKNLGIYVRLEILPPQELEARVRVGNFSLALYTQIGPSERADRALEAFCSQSERGNLSRLSDADYDALWTASCQDGLTASEAEALEQRLWELCPSVPLAFPTRWFGTGKGITQLRIRPFATAQPYEFENAGKEE